MTSRSPRSRKRKPSPRTTAEQEPQAKPPISFPVVGIGASAGGLEAFTQLLGHLPVDTGMAFILVQHLAPEHESVLPQILSRVTKLAVQEITDGLRVQPNHVYVIPRDKHLTIARGVLEIRPRPQTRPPPRSIDAFFESLAQDARERAIGVVLSGTGSDGTQGLEAIKAEGGITFAQDESAKHDSMPRSAAAAGVVDFVLSPHQIAAELARIAAHPFVAGVAGAAEAARAAATAHEDDAAPLPSGGPGGSEAALGERVSPRAADGYKSIVAQLRQHSGVDFSLYRSTTIQRRIGRRLVLTRQNTLADYAKFLRGNPPELDALYSDVLISVTSFFRNPEAFETLKREVFPKLLDQRNDGPVRVWILGCSTGQEAYSIAIAFVETAEQVSRTRPLQVFATDLNEKLLDKARQGLYAKSLAEDIAPDRLRRFFIEEEGGYRINKMLRDMVVFARQNLISDPPFSRMDLISCRNLLIYLEPALQQKALPTFHYALKPNGYLLLGSSESVGQFTDLFAPVDSKHKIYVKKPAPTPTFHLPVRREPGESGLAPTVREPVGAGEADGGLALRGELGAQREADRIALGQFAPPGVLINDALQVLQFRGATGAFLQPPQGKASFDVLRMAREGLTLPLRSAIDKARKENKAAVVETVRVTRDGETRTITVHVIPLRNVHEPCFLVLFQDQGPLSPPATPTRTGIQKHEEPGRIAELEGELAQTREYVRSIQEQYEASNEELQASNEEAQSANEELQSVNEELETSKEELESANEELTTVNEEMGHRNTELTRLNNDLVNLETSSRIAVVLVGRDLTIRHFSPQAEKHLPLTSADVGRPIGNMRHNLVRVPQDATNDPVRLEELAAEVVDTVREQELEVRSKEGRWYSLLIRPYITRDKRVDGAVLVLFDVSDLKESEQVVTAARDYAENLLETVRQPLLVLDHDLRVQRANRAFYTTFGVKPEDTEKRLVYDLGNGQWNIPKLRELLANVLPRHTTIENFEVEHHFEAIGPRAMVVNARQVDDPKGRAPLILMAIEDITDRKQSDEALLEGNRAKDQFLAMLSHELRTPLSALLLQATVLRRAASDPTIQRSVDIIERAAKTQARLIDDLLDVSRITAGKLEMQRKPVDIAKVVHEAIDLVKGMADTKSVQLEAEVDETSGAVLGDPDRLRQAVWNLLTNAIKFTPGGGRVSVSAEPIDAHARVKVADTGVGIKPAMLPRIFDMFFQAEQGPRGGGLGLGLALVRKIVEHHGGTVQATSGGKDQGSTFTLSLPVITGEPEFSLAESGERRSPERDTALAGTRILVVEDDIGTRESMQELLEMTGAQVQTAESEADARKVFEEFRPDLLVSDIAMPPGDDGYALLRRIRALGAARGGDVPAIALTALATAEDRRKTIDAGFQMHLAKPVDAGDLIGALVKLKRGRTTDVM